MPINSKLPSPAELLYQCQLRTTIPAKICNSDPSAIHICEQINTHSEAAKSQADKCNKTLAPLYAGQPVATYDTFQKLWVPATVICILPWSSYLDTTLYLEDTIPLKQYNNDYSLYVVQSCYLLVSIIIIGYHFNCYITSLLVV